MTIGNGLQPPGNGGCKVGNVYIATTLLSSYSLQDIRIPALPMASPFSLPWGSGQNDLLIRANQPS